MRKETEQKLKEIAREILETNDFSDTDGLKLKIQKIYDELAILSYLEKENKENDSTPPVIERETEITPTPETEKPIPPDELETIFEPTFDSVKEDMSLKDEFRDTVSLDETEKLFEGRPATGKSVSLNDRLVGKKIQVDLNDRIAFVNRLFNHDQDDFKRTLDALNACKSKSEALDFIQNRVKTKYNWNGKEDIEERFIALIERKFL